MKKLFLMGILSGCLTACYCHKTCSVSQTVPSPAPVSAAPQQAATEEMPAQPANAPVSQAASAQVNVTSSAQSASKTAPAVVTAAPVMASISEPVAEEPGFTVEKAAVLIAQKRTKQTLSQTPADTPSFEKEEMLSTQDRLLSPLAYGPVQADNTHAPWSNEQLKYGLYYSFIKAGTAYIKTRGITEYNGKKAYLIQTTAFSASAIDAVFRVRDINFSWIDVQNHYSLGYAQSVREGNYVRDEWLSFEPENQRFYGEIRKKKEPRTIAGELDQPVLDMLSSLYFVRSQPLEVGKDLSFDIINREERYPLLVKVLGKETVKTKAGKFNCWVVEPQFRGEGIFVAKGKSLKVWLTDDQYRMPIKMSVEVFIGSVYAELLDYKRN